MSIDTTTEQESLSPQKRKRLALEWRKSVASLIDNFQYQYRDLAEFADLVSLFTRKFHLSNDVIRCAVAEGGNYGVTCLGDAIFPFEFFELVVDDCESEAIAIPNSDNANHLQIRRIIVARTMTHLSEQGESSLIQWVAPCLTEAKVDSHAWRWFGHAILLAEINGEYGAPPISPLARSGHLNLVLEGDEEMSHAQAFTSYGDDAEAFMSVAWNAQAVLGKFCEILSHKSSSIVAIPAEISQGLSRAERRRVTAATGMDPEELPSFRSGSYRIVIRDTVASITQDVRGGKHLRYSPKRRHEVQEHLREYQPGKFTSIARHIRGGARRARPRLSRRTIEDINRSWD